MTLEEARKVARECARATGWAAIVKDWVVPYYYEYAVADEYTLHVYWGESDIVEIYGG